METGPAPRPLTIPALGAALVGLHQWYRGRQALSWQHVKLPRIDRLHAAVKACSQKCARTNRQSNQKHHVELHSLFLQLGKQHADALGCGAGRDVPCGRQRRFADDRRQALWPRRVAQHEEKTTALKGIGPEFLQLVLRSAGGVPHLSFRDASIT